MLFQGSPFVICNECPSEVLLIIFLTLQAALFVSAVGVPPKWAVDKLHAAGIPVMNMIGSPKHVEKAN